MHSTRRPGWPCPTDVLSPVNKNPGVRPIGICEVVRRIVAKAILSVTTGDIQQAAGSLQLCAGQKAGSEAAVHSMNLAFKDQDCEAVLFVDASNAFNSLNRQVALRNIRALCPPLATALINTYRRDAELFVDGKKNCTPRKAPHRETLWLCPCTLWPHSLSSKRSIRIFPSFSPGSQMMPQPRAVSPNSAIGGTPSPPWDPCLATTSTHPKHTWSSKVVFFPPPPRFSRTPK